MRTYYLLTKPGIIMGNLITTSAGFAMASKGHFAPFLFFAMLAGLGMVIASACVCNNYIDRISDAKMARTQNRALARGLIAPWKALLFASVLGCIGLLLLSLFTNALAAGIAAAGFVFYVFLYSLTKAHSTHATLVGSIAGAIPPSWATLQFRQASTSAPFFSSRFSSFGKCPTFSRLPFTARATTPPPRFLSFPS